MLDGGTGYRKRAAQTMRIRMAGNAGSREFQFQFNLTLNAIKRLKKLKHPPLALVLLVLINYTRDYHKL